MTSRRAPAGILAGAALLPPLLWLFPALFRREAPTFRDQGDFFFPLKLYTADRLRRGEIPLWNPLSGCGEPWLANLQSGVFSPPNLLFLIPSPALAAGLYLLLHFAVAAWGMRRFLREEGASEAAALAGSAAFAASGFTASLSAYWNHFGAFAWLPGLASLARGGLETRGARLGFAILFAIQALSGSPEISMATLALSALLVWRARRAPEGGFVAPSRLRLLRLACAAGLGIFLSAAALAPFLELAALSERRGPLPSAEREAGAIGWVGVPSLLGRSLESSGSSYLASVAAGTLALALAAAAFADRERRPLALLLAAVAAAGVLLAASGPPGSWLRVIPPLDRIRYPAKWLALPAFSVAALAGFGLDSVRFAGPLRRRAPVLALAAGGLLLVAISRQPPPSRIAEAAGIACLAVLAFVAPDGRSLPGFLQGIAALLLAGSLAWSGRALFRFAPEGEIRRTTAPIEFLRGVPGRVLTPSMTALVPYVLRDGAFGAATLRRQRETLLGYTNLLAGVRTLRTASPLGTASARRIVETVDAASDPQPPAGTASARLLWTPFLPPNMGSRKVGELFRAPINPYRPRLTYLHRYEVEPDAAAAWTRAASGRSDWSKSVLLDREPRPAPVQGSGRGAFLVSRIAEERPERLTADVTSDGAGILVLTDLAFPGWRAEVDGKPAPILLADGMFRAVALPAGSHRVAFAYRPLSLWIGAGLSGLALLALLLLARAGEPRRAGALL